MTNGRGKSHSAVVPEKLPKKAGQPAAQMVEGRGLTKGNLLKRDASRTQSRTNAHSTLERVRQGAKKDRKQRFTALLHHEIERLRAADLAPRREAAAGGDGEARRHFEVALEENLHDLAEPIKRGAYRAKPVRRAYIPKAGGQQRRSAFPRWRTRLSSAASGLSGFAR